MSRASSREKQGLQEIEGVIKEEGDPGKVMNQPNIEAQEMKGNGDIEEEEEEEEEGCKTPTPTYWSHNLMLAIQKCPPAPRKKRPNVLPSLSSQARFHFFEDIGLQEVDFFFQSITCAHRSSDKLSKRCRRL